MNYRNGRVSASLSDLARYFDAYIEKSDRRFHKVHRVDQEWFVDPKSTATDQLSYQMRMEYVQGIAIHIPEHRVDDFLSALDERRFKEIELRDQYPAVKKAYEQYKMMLLMCGFDADARY